MTPATDELLVGELMTRTFVSAAPEDTLGETVERMTEADAGSALVLEFGALTGILTSRDVLRAIAERVHPSEGRVRDWMTAAPVTASANTPAEEAARLMVAGGFHHLPVTDGERPLGVIGLRAVAGVLRGEGLGW